MAHWRPSWDFARRDGQSCIMLHDRETENSLKTNMYILEAAELHHARAMMRAYPSSQDPGGSQAPTDERFRWKRRGFWFAQPVLA